MVLSYEPAATDPFGILWIEHFLCERFSLELPFSVAKPTPTFSLLMRYTNEPDATGAPFNGAILLNRRLNNQETRVPAFDNQERNQCTGSEYQKLCEGPNPKPAISIDRQANNNGFVFTGKVENIPRSRLQLGSGMPLSPSPRSLFIRARKWKRSSKNPAARCGSRPSRTRAALGKLNSLYRSDAPHSAAIRAR
ncbi:hypothetical protein [Hymenobacter radiodurans]|uniref:hypothetical protein n=1 Tax=Hymenobacter radiodurans TaxID=2496028 RepID=UPI001058F5BF|nr:hypothetical protein [Hymenobacter radiodurans]